MMLEDFRLQAADLAEERVRNISRSRAVLRPSRSASRPSLVDVAEEAELSRLFERGLADGCATWLRLQSLRRDATTARTAWRQQVRLHLHDTTFAEGRHSLVNQVITRVRFERDRLRSFGRWPSRTRWRIAHPRLHRESPVELLIRAPPTTARTTRTTCAARSPSI